MEYILIALVSDLTHHSLGNLKPFILIYIITIFIIYHKPDLFFSPSGTLWTVIPLFLASMILKIIGILILCYLVWIVCIQVFIDFYFSLVLKLSNACCHGRFHKIKTLSPYLIIKKTFVHYKTKKSQLIRLLETLIWIFLHCFYFKRLS